MKTLYTENGLEMNEAGMQAFHEVDSTITTLYEKWRKKGYSPAEIRELFYNRVFAATTIYDALNSFNSIVEKNENHG